VCQLLHKAFVELCTAPDREFITCAQPAQVLVHARSSSGSSAPRTASRLFDLMSVAIQCDAFPSPSRIGRLVLFRAGKNFAVGTA
jgi:hypothetical protein